jgi:hypothetical protein
MTLPASTLPPITDPVFNKPERYNVLDRMLLFFIRDERDLPFIQISLAASLTLFPLAAVMFAPGLYRWWMSPIYWAVLMAFFLDRFILMLHNTSHRPLYKKQFGFMNHYIPWVLGPFFGETPETYFSHHLGMHHAENNMHDDLSSTLRYRRDNLLHFAHYFTRFFFVGVFELTLYFFRRRKYDLMARAAAGESVYILAVIGLLWFNPLATLTVFLVPFCFTRFAMMAGNWSQHAFIDHTDPGNSYRNSITCINTRYNRRCFNDGYHIGHHIRANRHWTEMPDDFIKNLDRYRDEGCTVFQGVDYFQIWVLLMTHNHKKLASHLVDLGPVRTIEERVAHLNRRLEPVIEAETASPDHALAAG